MRQLKITAKITDRNSSKAFNQYLFDLRAIKPFQTPDEEYNCAVKAYNGDEQALDELVRKNLKFVISVAKQYANSKAPLEELVNEGNYGLIEAARKFEPSRGFKFISYAVWYIRKNMSDYFNKSASSIRIPVNKINNLNKLKKQISIMEQINGRPVTSSDFIDNDDNNFNIDDVSLLMDIDKISVSSLDSPFSSDTDSGNMLDVIEDKNSYKSDSIVNDEDLNRILESLMDKLDEKQKEIIILSFGLYNQEPLTLIEIGERVNANRESVRQSKQKALKIMAKNMKKRGIKLEMLLN